MKASINKAEKTEFSARREGEVFYVQTGCLKEKDITQLDWMFQKALASGCRFLLFDCSYTKEICVPALRVFLANVAALHKKKMKMGIFGMSRELQNSFTSSGLDQFLTIGETEETVMARLNMRK